MKRHTLLGTLLGISLMSGSSLAHIEQSEPLQSLRQSYFALLGMTFAPMGDMVKGKIEWNDALFTTWAEDLNHAAQFGVERGFAPGTDKGTTRAKPNIWSNMDDFQSKLDDFRAAAAKLAETAAAGDPGRLSPGPKTLTTTRSGSAPPTTAAWADWSRTYRPLDPATWPE